MVFGPLCFSHPQKGPIEPVHVPVPAPLGLGFIRRGLGTDRPGREDSRDGELGIVKESTVQGTQGLGPSLHYQALAEDLEDCLFWSLSSASSPLRKGLY